MAQISFRDITACWPVHATLLLSLPSVTKLLKRDVAEPELKANIFIFFTFI